MTYAILLLLALVGPTDKIPVRVWHSPTKAAHTCGVSFWSGKMGCIYCATNRVNEKCYVGQTVYTIAYRRNQHEKSVGRGSSLPFHNALRKYGLAAFKWRILFNNIASEDLYSIEQRWIRLLSTKVPNGYNLTDGGKGVFGLKWREGSNRTRTLEHRMKIRKALVGRKRSPFSDKWRKNIGLASKKLWVEHFERKDVLRKRMLGNTNTLGKSPGLETRAKMSEAKTGSRHSNETKRKISQSNMGKHSKLRGEVTKQKNRKAASQRKRDSLGRFL